MLGNVLVYNRENHCTHPETSILSLLPLVEHSWHCWSGPAARAGAGLSWTRRETELGVLRAQEHGQVRILFPHNAGAEQFPGILRSQLFKAAGSSLAGPWLCSPRLAESRRIHQQQSCCLSCSSAQPSPAGEFAVSLPHPALWGDKWFGGMLCNYETWSPGA